MIVDEWIEVEASSRNSAKKRKITESLDKVSAQDSVIISELSRLGQSIKAVLQIIEELIQVKRCKLILIKQNLHLNPNNQHDMTNNVLLTIFLTVAELERDFISEKPKMY